MTGSRRCFDYCLGDRDAVFIPTLYPTAHPSSRPAAGLPFASKARHPAPVDANVSSYSGMARRDDSRGRRRDRRFRGESQSSSMSTSANGDSGDSTTRGSATPLAFLGRRRRHPVVKGHRARRPPRRRPQDGRRRDRRRARRCPRRRRHHVRRVGGRRRRRAGHGQSPRRRPRGLVRRVVGRDEGRRGGLGRRLARRRRRGFRQRRLASSNGRCLSRRRLRCRRVEACMIRRGCAAAAAALWWRALAAEHDKGSRASSHPQLLRWGSLTGAASQSEHPCKSAVSRYHGTLSVPTYI